MDGLLAWQPIRLDTAGTLCAGCQSRGVWTAHSPAGEQHAAWKSMWARDSSWTPDGAPEKVWLSAS